MTDLVDLSRSRVLIVDDVPSNIDVLVETLRDHHLISVAIDGESALKSIAHDPPDLVMLDLMMPRLDGFEVCRRIRAAKATADIPVIFLSALGEPKSKARAFEAGGSDYITKPFEGVEVRARVRSLLQAKVDRDTARASLASELRVAREIQRGMLPKDFARLSSGLPIDVYALLEPAHEVGGDFYDVFPLGNGRVCLVIGDVSGKGAPAALLMAVATTLVRATARHVQQPEQILAHVNQELSSRELPSSMFVTLFCAILDARSGQIRWANAGHTPPILARPGDVPRFILDQPGKAIGADRELVFEPRGMQLQAGDALVLYTGGVVKALDPQRRTSSEDPLLSALGSIPSTAKDMVERIAQSLRAAAPDGRPAEDIAFLAIRWAPPQ